MTTQNVLFIAYGNSLRRDDGAGIELARRVYAAMNSAQPTLCDSHLVIQLCEFQQLAPELAYEITDASLDALFFFDCEMMEGSNDLPDAGRKIQLSHLPPATRHPPPATFAHYLTPQTLLAIASALYGPLPPAWLVTIPGFNFELGEGFSKEVDQLLNQAPEIARMMIERMRVDVGSTPSVSSA